MQKPVDDDPWAEAAALAQKEKARAKAEHAKATVDAFHPLKIAQADSGLHGAWPFVIKHVIADYVPGKVGKFGGLAHPFSFLKCPAQPQGFWLGGGGERGVGEGEG